MCSRRHRSLVSSNQIMQLLLVCVFMLPLHVLVSFTCINESYH